MHSISLVAEKDSASLIDELIYMRLIIDVSFTRVTVYEAAAVHRFPSDIDHSAWHASETHCSFLFRTPATSDISSYNVLSLVLL